MRDIRECNGPWRGQWVQHPVRGTMRLGLEFRDCAILGGGSDRDGAFAIVGRYEPETHRVRFLKRYPVLDVVYDGFWNGSYVSGTSIIGDVTVGECGSFELWPEDEESGFGESESIENRQDLREPIPMGAR